MGTGWQIDTAEPISTDLRAAIAARIETFDRAWSRFRDDSLVSRIARTPGSYRLPDEADELLSLYRDLYEATDAAVSPLVGRALEALGYDRAYSLRPSGPPAPPPAWEDAIAWDGSTLTTVRPVLLDVGAAGKGLLVDIVTELLVGAGHTDLIVDGSGDIRQVGPEPIRVGLEHPLDATKAIGIANVHNQAICSSATNRRAWGAGLHHVIDATTGLPTSSVIATWAIAATAMLADGLSTALFFADPARLNERYDFTFARVFSTGRVEFSPHLDGELFT
ncbi:MAG TPA: FAD:protein FMN transferase [Rhodoglobus sp.]|nr:FAD:protein FMN transferase [Rhodoglobus sp.]HQA22188.1 FAD:protein FMN transferase [Rhodoglobus sp.]